MEESIWRAKLAAWTHDPAEKALVLLRDPAGHEAGTLRQLREMLFPEGVDDGLKDHIRRADHWSSAADRPQFPRSAHDGSYAAWTQVRFSESPELIHPLSGERIQLSDRLDDVHPEHIKAVSFDHFAGLVQRREGRIDPRRTALAFWRFGPELAAANMESLWKLLPADTRVPDHTIWAHLDKTSAFASAFTGDGQGTPALLSMSFGPVQGFIAQARTTSDLWAGSHLLSRMVWEGLKVICEALGPDAVIFPQLRGVPLVDLWLQHDMQLPQELFKDSDWRRIKTDANPLFGAALPNKFMALVPQDQVTVLAREVTRRVRDWVQGEARGTVDKLLAAAQIPPNESLPCYRQIREQLAHFPEVSWAAVPWTLVHQKPEQLDISALQQAMAPFSAAASQSPGFLGSEAWRLLSRDLEVEGVRFFQPNSGVLYPALYDLLDRFAGAAKGARPFAQQPQEGYRCSLCGENEWLTNDSAHLHLPPGKQKDADTLWAKVAAQKPSWARKGEHLCASCAIKRLWPNRFASHIAALTDMDVQRFVVSTHTMALATSLGGWLETRSDQRRPLPPQLKALLEGRDSQAALPRKLAGRLAQEGPEANLLLRRLPVLFDEMCEQNAAQEQYEIENLVHGLLGDKPEAYYGLIMLDGDRMGAWLNGSEESMRLRFRECWHSQIAAETKRSAGHAELAAYLEAFRPPSPARHMAISSALNGFALDLVRHVVEDLYKGKLLYAGGDDVLAMVSVDDLLPAMLLLRLVYSGIFPHDGGVEDGWREILGQRDKADWLDMARGHVRYRKRLYRMMGAKATASAGAVVAHHTAPLSSVLRALRQAEQSAKNTGRRDAFSIRVLKRAGGAVHLTSPWFGAEEMPTDLTQTAMGRLIRLRDTLAGAGLARRAAYLVQQWAAQLPDASHLGGPEQYQEMLATTLAYQFGRQSSNSDKHKNMEMGRELAVLAMGVYDRSGCAQAAEFLVDFISVAEFLAREGRGARLGKENGNG